MSYFALPRSQFDQYVNKLIEPQFAKLQEIEPVINKTLKRYLTTAKTQIDSCPNEWDRWKKYTNPCEYIHTQVPGGRSSVCRLKPLSRSFFKMVEACNTHKLLDDFEKPIKTFHFAEGPGGFIEAIAMLRNEHQDLYLGMTLVDEHPAVPGWKKTQQFLEKNPNVSIYKGKTGTGDMTQPTNLRACYEEHNSSCDIVTGDGGFDFTSDFDHQEVMSTHLILCQVAFAAAVQRKGGSFFIKMFETFTSPSVEILYLLSILYENVYMFKPNTSRVANSEKYIMCKGFRLDDSRNIVIALYHVMQGFKEGVYLHKLLNLDVPYSFSIKVEEYNAIFGQQQVECISTTMGIINASSNNNIENMKRANIQKCVSWCQRHKLPYNKQSATSNAFMNCRSDGNLFLGRNNTQDDDEMSCEGSVETNSS